MKPEPRSLRAAVLRKGASWGGSLIVTLGIFLVLPLMEAIGQPPGEDLIVRGVDMGALPPPPPPPPEAKEEDPPPEPPKLDQEIEPMDLSQLELALTPGLGESLFGTFSPNLVDRLTGPAGGDPIDRIFSLSELDRRPRVLFQRVPDYPRELKRQRRQGTVHVVFMVDTEGRVMEPVVHESTDPAFERSALEAVRQWRFEPGTRKGEKVRFKMRIPITFNAG